MSRVVFVLFLASNTLLKRYQRGSTGVLHSLRVQEMEAYKETDGAKAFAAAAAEAKAKEPPKKRDKKQGTLSFKKQQE